MTSRRDARRTAIDILFQADVTGAEPSEVMTDWIGLGKPVPEFASQVIEGVAANLAEIDRLLEASAQDWTVARMAVLDRTILRVATYELLHRPDVPHAAAISEAVETAAELSSDESRSFVNGILGKLARELSAGQAGG